MANPPVNRRPGVDADIIQGTWVRGYDVPAGDQTLPVPSPCDLIVSNGKSQIDGTLSNLIFAQRTDALTQPVFVMAQGDDPTAPIGTVNFHIGREADPNALITGVGAGSLYASYGTAGLWQLQDDNTTWVQISDDLGGEDLQQTLAIGNTTGGFNILLTNGDFLKGEDSAVGDGASANIAGGNATGGVGDGGRVLIQGGTSVAGQTGDVDIYSPDATSTGGSGVFQFRTGTSKLGGNSGSFVMATGEAGDVGFAGTAGSISIIGGRNRSSGAGAFRGGIVNVTAGQATSQGEGGYISLRAGSSSDFDTFIAIPVAVAGRGGGIGIIAGSSSGSQIGGGVSIVGGTGGSGGATGGDILLRPGNGGGGFDDGLIIGDGIFQADNIKRGSGDPNGSVNGNEGDVYQRTDAGLGQIWLNTAGTDTSWVQLAAVGDFIESFEQLNWGYFCRSGIDYSPPSEDAWFDGGLFKGLRSNSTAGDDPTFGGNLDNGPYVSFSVPNNTDVSAIDFSGGAGSLPHARENKWILTFRARNSNSSAAGRYFLGVSTLDAQTQLASTLPGGGSYLGFIYDGSVGGTWRVITSNGLGVSGPFDTGISAITTSTTPEGWHFIIDSSDGSVGGVTRFFILDPDLQVQSSIIVPTTIPTPSTNMGLVMGVRRINAAGATPTLQVVHASLVNDAGVSGQGGGTVSGLTLAQVLVNGNTTGTSLIEVNQGSGLIGVTDDNAGDGASYSIFGGATTLATNDTGTITVASGNAFGGGAENPGSTTGDATFATGNQFALTSQGDTGAAALLTGSSLGTDGTTGSVVITSGFFLNAAAGTRTQGDILIAPGTFGADNSTVTGEVIIKGGSSLLADGGDVTIMSGEAAGASGNTGEIIIESFDVNLNGDSGDINISSGNGGAVSGESGAVRITTGSTSNGNTGFVGIGTNPATGGSAGTIVLVVGGSDLGNGSDITLSSGSTTDLVGTGGNITLTPGTGPAGDGEVVVNGKLTVTGPIDPTALGFSAQASNPITIVAGVSDGVLWVNNSDELIFSNSGGDTNISTGGGATTLGALTDVTLTAPAPGETLTYNGVDWVNLPGAGGSPLATILGIGNTTGALPIVVEDTLGSFITSDGNLRLNPAVAAGNKVIIDGIQWPEADGPSGYVLTTNGLGVLSFQPGGGGGTGPSFGEAFSRMQWGSVQASNNGGSPFKADGILSSVTLTGGAALPVNDANGYYTTIATLGAPGDSKGLEIEQLGPGVGIELQSKPVVSFKFDAPNLDTNIRFFVGLTSAPTIAGQTGVPLPIARYVGLQLYTDIPQTTFHFVTDDNTGAPSTFNTGVTASGTAFELVVDASLPGQVLLTLYDNTGTQLAQHTFVANLPLLTVALGLQVGMTTTNAAVKIASFYTVTAVTRADLLGAAGGGGGSQDLSSVLGFGNSTGGLPIQGDDNVAGDGGDLALQGGASTGAGGRGGDINLTTGAADPGGIGRGGNFVVATNPGAGTGDGGDFAVLTGAGGVGGGDGGSYQFIAGDGNGIGSGGAWVVTAGDSGSAAGSFAGAIGFTTGSGSAGSGATGGRFQVITGDGNGTGNGGGFLFTAGDGGAGGGDGGSFVLTAGAGNGGGVDGTITLDGDVSVTGKLTVTGMIDPPGLLMSSSGAVPFTPVGSEGGIWVNAAGELVYTNAGSSLNLSTAIGGGMTFLDAMLTAGYGMLSAGDSTGPQSYGVYGSSINLAVSPGPPPASAVFSEDTDGPYLNLAVGAAAVSETFLGTADLFIQRSSQFKARVKFQVTSPAHTDQRIFIGFTDDGSLVTPSAQLAFDDPAAVQYMGIRQNLAGANFEFVARGSGGAMVPVFGLPTDALVHYLEIDASAASGDVTFSIIAADGTTVEVTHTEPASLLLPDLANPLRPFTGIYTATGTTPRGIDFYYSTIVTRADVVDAVTGGGGGGGTPSLDLVLAAGNATGANGIEFSIGNTGITTETSAGAGANLFISAGDAGGVGNNGGILALTGGLWTGAPGKPGAVLVQADSTASGGATGAVNLLGGVDATGGGASVRVDSAQGAGGGGINLLTGGGIGGNNPAGNLNLDAGVSQGTSTGGSINLTAGNGGGGGGVGDGGRILLQAGSPLGTGSEGGIDILAGGAIAPTSGEGTVQLASSALSGDAATESLLALVRAIPGSGDGGSVTLQAGRADVGSGGDGGDISIITALGDGAGDAGNIYLLGDGASPIASVSPGGAIQLIAATDATNSTGGQVLLDGGGPVISGSAFLRAGAGVGGSGLGGGLAAVIAGNGDGASPGGFVLVRGGDGGATGDGGDAQLRGGDATGGVNFGGDVRLVPGVGPAGGGTVKVEGRLDPAVGGGVAGIQFGTFAVPGIPGGFAVLFNTAFGAPPSNIQLTMESSVAGLGGGGNVTVSVAPGTITTTGFTLNVGAAGAAPGPLVVHWLALA
jgi:hypothetical protein